MAHFLIDPHAVYDDGAVSLALGIPTATLERARRTGALRYARKGRRAFYLGRWLIAWFEAGEPVASGADAPGVARG